MPLRADLAGLLDWVEGLSAAAHKARDEGNITLAEALETTRFEVDQGYLAELHHADDQLTPPDRASQYDAPAAPACSVSLATLLLVAMGHPCRPRMWHVNPPPNRRAEVLTLLSSGDHDLGDDPVRLRPGVGQIGSPWHARGTASRWPAGFPQPLL
jgi:hypothetical protein